MKIGTITFSNSINYGAILQAYALQRILIDMGHEAVVIDYNRYQYMNSHISRFHRVRNFIWQRIIKRMIVGTRRQKKTDEFYQKYVTRSELQYLDPEALHLNPPQCDAYVTGSDQVWNPRIINRDSSYFLTFSPPDKVKISYAASFGIAQIPETHVSEFRMWLSQIHHLSTREYQGAEIIKELTGLSAEVVLDPTLLLSKEQWSQVSVPYQQKKPYVLCYYMPGDKVVNRSITKIARRVSSLMGYGIICIGQKEYMKFLPWKKSIFDAGPAEFVGLIENASFVVTNSFHGTAFSIIFKKPFLVPINNVLTPDRSLSSRITSLLKLMNLDNRLIAIKDGLQIESNLDLNYEHVEKTLIVERQKSLDYLKNALSEGLPCQK